MLKGNTVQFILESRMCTQIDSVPEKKEEWVLKCKMGDCSFWCFKVYEDYPSEGTIKRDIQLIMKSFEFYHKHLEIPEFSLQPIVYFLE